MKTKELPPPPSTPVTVYRKTTKSMTLKFSDFHFVSLNPFVKN